MQKLADANDIAIESETKSTPSSVKSIKQKIKPTVSETFFVQADEYVKNLHASGKYNQYTADKSRIRHLREFMNDADIAFTDTSALDKILRLHVTPAAGINHKLTMQIARHTFGGLAGNTIPIQMLQKLYRHSNVSTTIGDQSNFTNKDADDALDAVIGKAKNQKTKI